MNLTEETIRVQKFDASVFILMIVKLFVSIWDFVTFPIYQAIYKPWEKRKYYLKPKSKCLSQYTTSSQMVFEANEKDGAYYREFVSSNPKTMVDAWKWAVQRNRSKPALGTREILKEEDEVQKNGKIFKKYDLGEYRWLTYEDADYTSDYIGRGLRRTGLEHGEKVCIFADTRAEWLLTAHACFKQGFPIVTLYTNLGEEAVIHGVNETEVTHIITSHELLPKFRSILPNTPKVTHVIYMEHQVERTETKGYPDNVQILAFYEVLHTGKKLVNSSEVDPIPPKETDAAIVMYTSGSTGVPKGVIMSHRNMLSTARGLMQSFDLIPNKNDTYLCFLPLAHVLELLSENMWCLYGVKLGYSSPNTMIDQSSMVKRGCKGDANVLKPTFMACVPLILDRVYKGVSISVSQGTNTFQAFFQWAYDYRLKALRNGEETPILNEIMFKGFRSQLGGHIRGILAGGAPLSAECHDYIRVVMGAPVMQGYGLTETTCCATVMDIDDFTSTTKVGSPVQGAQIKLVNWEEGGYKVTDKPNPRGEIHIGGSFITEGYYKNEAKTKEEYYKEYGRRWFKSGDIGEVAEDGQIKIIDRRKDLVKLQFGEYVSLGKVEAVLKSCPVVENVCIYGDSFKSYCVALVTPDTKGLIEIAQKYNKGDLEHEAMCNDKDVTGGVLREIISHSKKLKLEKFEIPGAVTIVKEVWVPETGLLTSAMKLKRKAIQDFYQIDIDRMYGM